jgi:general secretion pathway protein I
MSYQVKKQAKRARGFTLVEMIVATVLLAIGVVAALSAFSSATQATTAANQVQTASLLARRHLSETELQADSLTGGDQEGDFGDEFHGYHWRQSVEATDYPNLFKVTVTVQWGAAAQPHERAITTYLRNDQNQQNQQNGSQPAAGPNGQPANPGGGTSRPGGG